MPGAYLWGWDGAVYHKVIVDAAGHLQIDVLTTALPAGGATAANQLIASDWLSRINVKLRCGLPAALVGGSLSVIQNAASESHIYGYNGGAWQRLRAITLADAFTTPTDALQVGSFLMGYDGGDWNMVRVDAAGHLQIDVLSSALPTGAATAAAQAISNDWLSRINVKLAGGLPAALVGGALSVVSSAASQGHIYGFDGTNWQTLLVEAAALKNLRVRLYSGADPIATDGLDSVIVSSGALGILTRSQVCGYNLEPFHQRRSDADALAAVARELCQFNLAALYGFNGSTWDRIRTESSTAFNLRVRLYGGATAVNVSTMNTALVALSHQGLAVKAGLYVQVGANLLVCSDFPNSDGFAQTYQWLGVGSTMRSFNGATWDRIRSYGVGILKVGRAEVGLLTVRKTVVGQVGAAGARKLFWMLLNPSAGNSVFELTDATVALQAIVLDHFDTTRDGHMLTFDPPMEFSNGIYLETITNITSIIFGYL